MDLPGAETGEGDGTAVAALGRWLLVLAEKKQWPRWFWPLFLASSSFLLFSFPPSLFCFLFPFFLFSQSRTETPVLCVLSARLWLFFLLFSLRFSLLFMLFLSASVRSLEGLIYSLNISLFRKDSMH